jgi:hypothetical protein
MPKHTPKTLTEALSLGHQKLADHEKQRAHATFGAAKQVADCSTLNPGDKCAETACVNGFRIVMYCDGSNGCTHYVKIPC